MHDNGSIIDQLMEEKIKKSSEIDFNKYLV